MTYDSHEQAELVDAIAETRMMFEGKGLGVTPSPHGIQSPVRRFVMSLFGDMTRCGPLRIVRRPRTRPFQGRNEGR